MGALIWGQLGSISEYKGQAHKATEALESLQKSLNLRDLSCKQDMDSTVELETENKYLNGKSDVITQEISNLPSGVKKPTNNMITEAPKNAEESNVLTGSELLSDDLRKLLLQSYCNIEPSDQQCLSP